MGVFQMPFTGVVTCVVCCMGVSSYTPNQDALGEDLRPAQPARSHTTVRPLPVLPGEWVQAAAAVATPIKDMHTFVVKDTRNWVGEMMIFVGVGCPRRDACTRHDAQPGRGKQARQACSGHLHVLPFACWSAKGRIVGVVKCEIRPCETDTLDDLLACLLACRAEV